MTVRFSPDQSWLHTPLIFAPASSMAKHLSTTVCVPPWIERIMPSWHQPGRYCRFGYSSVSRRDSSS